jgi:hypothetical protein
MAACNGELDRPFGFEKRVRSHAPDCRVVIRSPRYNGRYPVGQAIPLRVEIFNPGDTPRVVDLGERRRGDCNYGPMLPLPAQRDPVELLFVGHVGGPDRELQLFTWRAQPAARFASRMRLEPGQSRVLFETTFVPPKDLADVDGSFCLRAWNIETDTGVSIRRRRY